MKASNGSYQSNPYSDSGTDADASAEESKSSMFEHTASRFHNFVDGTLRPDLLGLFDDLKRLGRAELDVLLGQASGIRPLIVTAAVGCIGELALLLFTVVFFGSLLGSSLGADSLSADTRMWAIGISIFLIAINMACAAWIVSLFRRLTRSTDQIFRS